MAAKISLVDANGCWSLYRAIGFNGTAGHLVVTVRAGAATVIW